MSTDTTANLISTETVLVQDYYPESVNVTQTERVLERNIETTVVVTGILAPISATTISGSSDVNISQLTNGALLVYQENIATWIATKTLEDQIMNGGFF